MALFSNICDFKLLAVVNTALGWKPHPSIGLDFVPCAGRSLCRHGATILYSAPHASLSFCKPRPKGHFSDRAKNRGVTLSWEPRFGMADSVLGWLCAQYQPGSQAGMGTVQKMCAQDPSSVATANAHLKSPSTPLRAHVQINKFSISRKVSVL